MKTRKSLSKALCLIALAAIAAVPVPLAVTHAAPPMVFTRIKDKMNQPQRPQSTQRKNEDTNVILHVLSVFSVASVATFNLFFLIEDSRGRLSCDRQFQ